MYPYDNYPYLTTAPYYGNTQQYQYPYQQQQPQPQTVNNMTPMYWVQGEAAALSYQLKPNEKVFFMDIEKPLIYMREADQTGKPMPMIVKELTDPAPAVESVAKQPKVDLSEYVKADDVQRMVEEEVSRRMSEISFKPTSSKRKVEE